MSTAPHARRAARRSACLRVLVLLLALLVQGEHAEAHAAPVVAVAGETGETGGTAAEQDVIDAALRPPARHGERAVVRLRPAPLTDPAPARAEDHRPAPVPPHPPYRLHALRSVVLRC
ncbi:hypothetical protein ABZV31_25580 [Streptomyces sp. NPDC005202]|uniref:hypothetical protein n=1 Tax=Streptomyces sp. NPDC005202 TaxID=3157021 RepID=UPI0033A89B59